MEQILTFLSGGVVGGLLGGFFGGFSTFLWEKWLPDWMTWRREQEVNREKLLSQVRGPAIRAISELQARVYAILRYRASNYDVMAKLHLDPQAAARLQELQLRL